MSSQLRSESASSRNKHQYYNGFQVTDLSQIVGYSATQTAQNPGTLYYQPIQEDGPYCTPQSFQSSDCQLCSDDSSQGTNHCTFESSSAAGSYATYNSPSTLSFSPNGSPISQQESQNTYGSPISVSCVTEDFHEFRHKLRELEAVMLGPDLDTIDSWHGPQLALSEADKWKQVMEVISSRDLKQLLIACAKAVSDHDLLVVDKLIGELRTMVSVSGDPIQRLSAYMLEGLIARLASSGSSIYKSLRCREPLSSELLSYMHLLYEVCPFFKFGYMSANGAIAEAVKDENRIHIIDFQIAQGTQWISLIQALAARPSGPPYIRITGIDDSNSAYARGGGLQIVGQRLLELAESKNVPFEFHTAAMCDSKIELGDLGVRPGEAIAVNFPFMLHHLPDESVSTQNYRDRLLRLVKSLSPKVVTLVEQESNTNTSPFFPRFLETLSYYTAIFESIDVMLPRDHKERINVEQHCLARDIVNIIACEGAERVERHELFRKWRSRFRMAGFTPYSLSSVVNTTIKTLLDNYSKKYRLEERDGALYLGWMDRDLVSSCAWR
ncbi:hypothetical protein GIB67_013389 [Kingdonia uniflora]|uniref:Uncharacterized protein n=1 Tax=Kingdonia uniflora TaxID=39325 RepID=A0A7J7LR65_9MAGN|nr:hypothetical protein GIB67_013389 [Kingdonia uniflora]